MKLTRRFSRLGRAFPPPASLVRLGAGWLLYRRASPDQRGGSAHARAAGRAAAFQSWRLRESPGRLNWQPIPQTPLSDAGWIYLQRFHGPDTHYFRLEKP